MSAATAAAWLLASALAASQPLQGGTPVHAWAEVRRGMVAPVSGGEVSLDDLLQAVRDDALLAWRARGVTLPGSEGAPVASALPVIWPDGSLGCAMPGRAYTQALVPGWRIEVRAGERLLVYHASRRGQWLLCPSMRALRAPPAPPDR